MNTRILYSLLLAISLLSTNTFGQKIPYALLAGVGSGFTPRPQELKTSTPPNFQHFYKPYGQGGAFILDCLIGKRYKLSTQYRYTGASDTSLILSNYAKWQSHTVQAHGAILLKPWQPIQKFNAGLSAGLQTRYQRLSIGSYAIDSAKDELKYKIDNRSTALAPGATIAVFAEASLPKEAGMLLFFKPRLELGTDWQVAFDNQGAFSPQYNWFINVALVSNIALLTNHPTWKND
ncbi:MAG: hypothetical protein RL660_1516 [Bacteroidota bacterium]